MGQFHIEQHHDKRLQYLNNAAHLLNASSPSIAAFLQARIDASTIDHAPSEDDTTVVQLSDAQKDLLDRTRTRQFSICSACGHMNAKVSDTDTALSPDGHKTQFITCRACGKTEAHQKLKKLKTKGKSDKVTVSESRENPAATSETPIGTPNPTAVLSRTQDQSGIKKKKAKESKTSSLSSMLAKSKQDEAASKPGFGLDLMDLMDRS